MFVEKNKEYRIEEDCTTYKRCGGCNLRHIDYEETLNIKQRKVENLVNKTLKGNNIEVKNVIGMGNPYGYRNKAQYPVGMNKLGEPVIGVFAERTHEIVPMQKCYIQNEIAEKIAFTIYKFIKEKNIPVYNESNRSGIIRHIVLHGDGYIYDILGEYTFKISPMSFYQINPVQAEVLYNIAIEMPELSKEDILFDLYCGIGTIGIFASTHVKKVYGIEIVEEAIKDAKENAKINNIKNIEFYAGDVEKIFANLIEKKQVYPDVIIVDPPRKGLDENTISNILAVKPRKVVYISCNPATMVRDMKLLEEKYETSEIQPVDMFPFTSHVECCSVLYLKN